MLDLGLDGLNAFDREGRLGCDRLRRVRGDDTVFDQHRAGR